MNKTLLILLLLCLSSACFTQKEDIQLHGVWFGATRLIDKEDKTSYHPISYYLNIGKDSLTVAQKTFSYKIKEDTIHLGKNNLTYSPKKDFLLLNGVNFFAKTQKNKNNIKEEIDQFNAIVEGKYWKNNNMSFYFTADKLQIYLKGKTHSLEYCYKIDRLEDYYFLKIYGNKWNCSTFDKFYTYQIIDFNKDKLKIYGFLNQKMNTLTLKKTKKKT